MQVVTREAIYYGPVDNSYETSLFKLICDTTRTDDKEASPSGSTIHDDSDTSCYVTEDEKDTQIHLGPKISIKEHLEKDKDITFLVNLHTQDDESLRNWKEQLLGRVDVSQVTDMTKTDKIEAKRTKPGTGMKREIEAK
nr:hypothetical protein [Tanacetum cinerariifolium]